MRAAWRMRSAIPHYVVDEAEKFERLVIDYFSSEYQAAARRTRA